MSAQIPIVDFGTVWEISQNSIPLFQAWGLNYSGGISFYRNGYFYHINFFGKDALGNINIKLCVIRFDLAGNWSVSWAQMPAYNMLINSAFTIDDASNTMLANVFGNTPAQINYILAIPLGGEFIANSTTQINVPVHVVLNNYPEYQFLTSNSIVNEYVTRGAGNYTHTFYEFTASGVSESSEINNNGSSAYIDAGKYFLTANTSPIYNSPNPVLGNINCYERALDDHLVLERNGVIYDLSLVESYYGLWLHNSAEITLSLSDYLCISGGDGGTHGAVFDTTLTQCFAFNFSAIAESLTPAIIGGLLYEFGFYYGNFLLAEAGFNGYTTALSQIKSNPPIKTKLSNFTRPISTRGKYLS